MKKFRLLKADEVDARIATVTQKGVTLLLYKDARCDMNILDETVGCFNWQKNYSRDNRNCSVSIWDPEKGQWISKEDVGTESYTEAEKGLASDSFKRACFDWGIGRELYSAPRIWIPADKVEIKPQSNNKYTCYDKFKVTEIGYDDKERINQLKIVKLNFYGEPVNIVYQLKPKTEEQKSQEKADAEGMQKMEDNLDKKISPKEANIVAQILSRMTPVVMQSTLKHYGVATAADLTGRQYADLMNVLKKAQEVKKS